MMGKERGLLEVLADIDRKLELAGGIENPMERFFKSDQLLELRGEIEAEIEAMEDLGDFLDDGT